MKNWKKVFENKDMKYITPHINQLLKKKLKVKINEVYPLKR